MSISAERRAELYLRVIDLSGKFIELHADSMEEEPDTNDEEDEFMRAEMRKLGAAIRRSARTNDQQGCPREAGRRSAGAKRTRGRRR